MPTIKNIVKDTSGAVLQGTATIELVIFDSGNAPVSFQGFVDIPADTTSDFTINVPSQTDITNGVWQASVRGNADITDAYGAVTPTYYKITEATSSVTRVYYISVPASGGPYWTGQLGVATPSISAGSFPLNALSDVDTTGEINGSFLSYNSGTGLWGPVSISSAASPTGSWTPTVTGPTFSSGTFSGLWEQISDNTYHISISLLSTSTWLGLSTSVLAATLPNTWTRHANKTQYVTGIITTSTGTVFYHVIGYVDPISKSNTAPTMKFFAPQSVSTANDLKNVNAVGVPTSFLSGHLLEVSGVIRVG